MRKASFTILLYHRTYVLVKRFFHFIFEITSKKNQFAQEKAAGQSFALPEPGLPGRQRFGTALLWPQIPHGFGEEEWSYKIFAFQIKWTTEIRRCYSPA